MTADELREATAEFDREFVGETFGPPTRRQQLQDKRARRKRGRPRVGLGTATVSLTIERGLLVKADRLAKRLRISRAALVARGLRAVLGNEAATS
jgi:hypothetical protein